MKLKKPVLGLIILTLISVTVNAKSKKSAKTPEKIKIVTTIFPQYDWTREILGDTNSAELFLLIGNGTDLHSYQPSIQDIAKISTADIFICVGGESDVWVKDALKNAKNKNMTVINLLEVPGNNVKEEEIVEGMQAEEGEDDEHHLNDEEEVEYDEHIWLSLRNAKVICDEICKALIQRDSANAAVYKEKLATYTSKLTSLDAKYIDTVNTASKNILLFGDRFPFRYLTDDYNLKYYAAFAGCSAETEASFETVIFLAKKVDELKLNYVLKIEGGDGKLARTIINSSKNKNAAILTIDSMQSVTTKQIANGTTYLSIMENNLKVIEQALN